MSDETQNAPAEGEDNRQEYTYTQDGIEHTILATPEDAEKLGATRAGEKDADAGVEQKAAAPVTKKAPQPENKSAE